MAQTLTRRSRLPAVDLRAISVRRDDPMPVYYQIAQAIRWRIGTGALGPGDRLPTVREGAARWAVNLHTVRRAYRTLTELGLVSSRPGIGTTVAGASADALAAATARKETGLVTVVECNSHQSRDLAAQIGAYWGIVAVPWLLDAPTDPPPGPLVGTRFHEGEMRQRWPDRSDDFAFVTLRADPMVADLVPGSPDGGEPRFLLCERDLGTGRAMASDLARLLPGGVAPDVTLDSPADAFARRGRATLLVAPRRWDEVPAPLRRHEQCVLVRHIVDPADMKRLGDSL